jgi:hypothetical protein
MVAMCGLCPGVWAEGTGTPPSDIPIAAMLEAGSLLERIQNPSVKTYLQRRLDNILALSNVTERVSRFDGFLGELQSATPVTLEPKTEVAGPGDAPCGVTGSLAATNGSAGAMDVEALNLLTKYACILYDLENRGFDVVRRELLDNINAAGLQPETMAMLRQLVMICDEAERSLSNLAGIKEDSAAETRALWWQNLGAYGATSVVTGDPLPLLQAAAGIVKGQQKVTLDKNRKIDAEIARHHCIHRGWGRPFHRLREPWSAATAGTMKRARRTAWCSRWAVAAAWMKMTARTQLTRRTMCARTARPRTTRSARRESDRARRRWP